MRNSVLPQKLRRGLTTRRLRKLLRAPSLAVRNFKFWWRDEVSSERHFFVVGPPRSGTTLVKNVLRAHEEICSVDGETYFFFRRNYADFRHPAMPDEQMKRMIAQARGGRICLTGLPERGNEKREAHFFSRRRRSTRSAWRR